MRTRSYGQANIFVFEHDHNFHQLFGKLAGQQVLKAIGQLAVIPEGVFLGSVAESAGPFFVSPFALVRQLGDVDGDAPRFVAGERLGRRSRIVEMYVGALLPLAVLHDEIRFAFLDRPGWREAVGGHGRWRLSSPARARLNRWLLRGRPGRREAGWSDCKEHSQAVPTPVSGNVEIAKTPILCGQVATLPGRCLLYPRKRTLKLGRLMSALCQKRTLRHSFD